MRGHPVIEERFFGAPGSREERAAWDRLWARVDAYHAERKADLERGEPARAAAVRSAQDFTD